MSAVYSFPIPLPPNVNGDTAEIIQIDGFGDQGGVSGPGFRVPTGYCWIMATLHTQIQGAANPTARVMELWLETSDPGAPRVWRVATSTLDTTGVEGSANFGLDFGDSTSRTSARNFFSVSLPWAVAFPGWQFLGEMTSGVGDTFVAGDTVTTFIQMEYGSSTGSGGGGAEVIGPALYVPGPEPVAA